MGISNSKADDTIDFESLKNIGSVYDTDKIYYDDDGNLRFGLKSIDRKAELLEFANPLVDDIIESDGKLWYIVDSSWLTSWLAYVQYSSDEDYNFPNPGPCNNTRLLIDNIDYTGWIQKSSLKCTTSNFAGDYRRISADVWYKFCKYYTGSGPEITCKSIKDEKTGYFTYSEWNIDQSTYIEPPNVEILRKKAQYIRNIEENEVDIDDAIHEKNKTSKIEYLQNHDDSDNDNDNDSNEDDSNDNINDNDDDSQDSDDD